MTKTIQLEAGQCELLKYDTFVKYMRYSLFLFFYAGKFTPCVTKMFF